MTPEQRKIYEKLKEDREKIIKIKEKYKKNSGSSVKEKLQQHKKS